LRGQAFRGEGKPSGLATDGLQGFIEFEGKLKAFGGHWAVKMDYGLRAAGGEGLSDSVAGAGVQGTVEAVGGLGGAELAGGAGGDGVLDGEWGAGGVGDGSGCCFQNYLAHCFRIIWRNDGSPHNNESDRPLN
jgi:hypothetical protein